MGGSNARRFMMAVLGALAGLSAWAAGEIWVAEPGRPLVFLTVALLAFFPSVLALAMPALHRRNLAEAALTAIPAAALVTLASLRFDLAATVFEQPDIVFALLVLLTVPLPFLIAHGRSDGNWRHYPTLFDTSWALTVRLAASLMFAGLVWVVLGISNELLRLVGIDVIGRLMENAAFGWIVSGLAFGLGLAVLNEFVDAAMPRLVLRFLRLFLPLALVVVVLFLAAVPVRGLSGLFGARSTGAIVLGTAACVVGLLSVAAAEDRVQAVQSAFMRLAARVLAMLLPLLAALAAAALAQRVGQYGWTPSRLSAAAGVTVVAGYGLGYAWAAVRPGDWMARLRRSNIVMAGVMVGLATLWLTPVLDAGALSARDQAARFLAGRTAAADVPVWEMRREWGLAGRRALDEMAAKAPAEQAATLAAQIAAADRARTRWDWQSAVTPVDHDGAEQLIAAVGILPAGHAVPDWLTARIARVALPAWSESCVTGAAGSGGDCALVIGDFLAASEGEEVMVLWPGEAPGTIANALLPAPGAFTLGDVIYGHDIGAGDRAAFFAALRRGDFALVPAGVMALEVGSTRIHPWPWP